MGAAALTHRDDGSAMVPTSESDWHGWVAATRTRSFLDEDPLLDWLDLHGSENGFLRDDELPAYEPETDFVSFIFQKGLEFEAAVIQLLQDRLAITVITESPSDVRSIDKANLTLEAMSSGKEAISQGVLWNPQDQTYGAPDLLIRSDILSGLFPEALSLDEAQTSAPGLGAEHWHYRVIDIKFTTLDLDRSGHEKKGHMAYMAQVFIYNEALGRIQGYLAPSSYLLGRAWKTSADRGRSCMEQLSRVDQDGAIDIRSSVKSAVDWIRRVRSEGPSWSVLPEPSIEELWPNLSNRYNHPWSNAKQRIAQELEDLTLLWQVGRSARATGHAQGIKRWSDPRCSAASLGVTGPTRPVLLNEIIQVNQLVDEPPLRRGSGGSSQAPWRKPKPVEFYVDFETVNNLNDDFVGLPEIGGQELIFMIGCGHTENDEWNFRSFIADELSEQCEATIIDAWFEHMVSVASRFGLGLDEALVFHWSKAETVSLETSYRSAAQRHKEKHWPSPHWYDLLQEVVRTEPVVVRGAMGFGLKAMAQAFHKHGFVSTLWSDGPADGLGAMVGAWRAYDTAKHDGCSGRDVPLMKEIASYNEVDCRVMQEIVTHLRTT